MDVKTQHRKAQTELCLLSYLQLHSVTAGKSTVPVPAPFQDQALDKQSNGTLITCTYSVCTYTYTQRNIHALYTLRTLLYAAKTEKIL